MFPAMREQDVQVAGLWASEGEPSSPFMSLLWVQAWAQQTGMGVGE